MLFPLIAQIILDKYYLKFNPLTPRWGYARKGTNPLGWFVTRAYSSARNFLLWAVMKEPLHTQKHITASCAVFVFVETKPTIR